MISFLRVIEFGIQDVVRNFWLSLITVTILILALFSINLILVVNVLSTSTVEAIKNNIDVSLYVKNGTDEEKINVLRSQINALPEAGETRYVSQNEALTIFKEKNSRNPEILQALRALGKNPLSATIIIKPKNSDNLPDLIDSLNGLESDIIESRNFDNHEAVINKINDISQKINRVGIGVSLIFAVITIFMVFNSIRMAIYAHKHEIAIMRLVGASVWFIRSPYVVSGIIYSLIGILAIIALFFPFLNLLHPYLETFFIGYDIDIFSYFINNFEVIFGLELACAILLNTFASLIAVGKYSRV